MRFWKFLSVTVGLFLQISAAAEFLYDFEEETEWLVRMADESAKPLPVSSEKAHSGRSSLKVPVQFPHWGTVFVPFGWSEGNYPGRSSVSVPPRGPDHPQVNDWSRYQGISFQLFVPQDAPKDVEVLLYIKDTNYWWYQKLHQGHLIPGRWNRVVETFDQPVDCFSEASKTKYLWQPRDNDKPWTRYSLTDVKELGIVPFSRKAYSGSFYIDDVELLQQGDNKVKKSPHILDFTAPARVAQYGRFESSFRLDKSYSNPFDPEEIDIQLVAQTPSGKILAAYGFYYQNYERTRHNGRENLVAVGQPLWKIRFAPLEVGEYSYYLSMRDSDGLTETDRRSFLATPAASDGFVRISPKDPLYFAFDSGRAFYPVGYNIRSSYDLRYDEDLCVKLTGSKRKTVDEKTYFYDRKFEAMSANGINATETWMCPWWVELEWNAAWDKFGGVGRYNLENAWRVDHLLEKAEECGIYINLALINHGQYSSWVDPDWATSPFNIRNGGFLRTPSEMFTDPRAKKALKNKLRYIISRYGHSRNILGWEVMSETDLTGDTSGSHTSTTVRGWVQEMAAYVKALDNQKHVVTNHYCGTYRNSDPYVFNLKEIDYVCCDAYETGRPFIEVIGDTAREERKFNKPALITECGGDPHGAPEDVLRGDLHTIMWGAYMTTLGGTPLFWWFNFIDDYGMHYHYKAFSRFVGGEDRAGRNLESDFRCRVERDGNPTAEVRGISLKNRASGYVWAYSVRSFEQGYAARSAASRRSRDSGASESRQPPARASQVKTLAFPEGLDRPIHTIGNLNAEQALSPEHRRDFLREVGFWGDAGKVCEGFSVVLTGMEEGTYRVEFWDTYVGVPVVEKNAEASGGLLKIELPPFYRDIACKIERIAAQPTAVSSPSAAQ